MKSKLAKILVTISITFLLTFTAIFSNQNFFENGKLDEKIADNLNDESQTNLKNNSYQKPPELLNERNLNNENNKNSILSNNIFENIKAGSGRNKLRYFRKGYIEAENGSFEVLRTPFTRSYWNGPILGKVCVKWSYKAKNDCKIKLYEDWVGQSGRLPIPEGEVTFYCKRILFHDWDYDLQYIDGDVSLCGVVNHLWIYGSEELEN